MKKEKAKITPAGPAKSKPAPAPDPVWLTYIYWAIPVLLFFVQYKFTKASMAQLRYEEVAESVRNVYWFHHGYITDGVSSNIGWYGTLMFIYKLFGFSLHTAKTFRLILHLVSLLALAEVLRRWMGRKLAVLPLVAAGLSPVWLYFNTFQASFGADLQYFPIALLLISLFRFDSRLRDVLLGFGFGTLCMIACMSYPSFLLYTPVLFLSLIPLWFRSGVKNIRGLFVAILSSLAGLAVPLAAGFGLVKNNDLLIYDPNAKAGLFRGGGKLEVSMDVLSASFKQTWSDLTGKGTSYYFDLPAPDLSGTIVLLSVIVALGAGVYFGWRVKIMRAWLILTFLLLLLHAVVPNLSSHLPGMRRGTGLIAGLYILFGISFYAVMKSKAESTRRMLIAAAFFVLPLASLSKIGENLAVLTKPGPFADPWFKTARTPEESLKNWVQFSESGQQLACMNENQQPGPCRYYEIFAAMAGYRLWNNLPYKPVMAYDWQKGKPVELSVELWERKEFP